MKKGEVGILNVGAGDIRLSFDPANEAERIRAARIVNSWAGAMCPTDDVLAHLMLMRGDEAMFWRRANQHAAIDPLAGL